MTDRLGTPESDPDRWETVLDSVEQAFTVALPRGWRNQARLARSGTGMNSVAEGTSPDGATTLFTGDPNLPLFVDPAFGVAAGAVVRPPTSIEHFLPGWTQHVFGARNGFRILGMMPSPPLLQLVHERAQRSRVSLAWATAGRLGFTFRSGDGQVNGLVFGTTWSIGVVWQAEVHGVTTTGDPEALASAVLAMAASHRITPAAEQRMLQERAASAANHQATMATIAQNTAAMTATHHQNLANIRSSAASHQAHMAAIHGAHDASNAAWTERQRSSDASHAAAMHSPDDAHRRFLETIAEQRTVVDAAGETYRVADGYDRYFRRRSDGSWIGLQSHQELSSVPGVDPRDFEEVKIVR